MEISRTLKGLLMGVLSFLAATAIAGDRIWLDAKINGKPVGLCFDTGANYSTLTPAAAQRLGVRFAQGPTNDLGHGVLARETEEFTLSLEGSTWKTSFLLLQLPEFAIPDIDGMVGWMFLSRNVMEIDAAAGEVTFLAKVPARTARWPHYTVVTNLGILDLQIPRGEHTNGVLCIDTGSPAGLELPSQEWSRWRAAHPQCPVTLAWAFSPIDGFYVYEEAWADQISIGPIVPTGVPIAQAGSGNEGRLGAQYEGTLGLAALRRLDLTVDGLNAVAYLRPRSKRAPRYNHNRLGAVFVPTGVRTNQAVARVVEGGPAYEAGVRNGDVLLQVDQVVVNSWSATWLSRFHLPAGTKLRLMLRRNEQTFTTTATLREIVHPKAKKND